MSAADRFTFFKKPAKTPAKKGITKQPPKQPPDESKHKCVSCQEQGLETEMQTYKRKWVHKTCLPEYKEKLKKEAEEEKKRKAQAEKDRKHKQAEQERLERERLAKEAEQAQLAIEEKYRQKYSIMGEVLKEKLSGISTTAGPQSNLVHPIPASTVEIVELYCKGLTIDVNGIETLLEDLDAVKWRDKGGIGQKIVKKYPRLAGIQKMLDVCSRAGISNVLKIFQYTRKYVYGQLDQPE